uniref:Family with sequence similarity 195, member A n=1 Tax=Nothobranchius furzeri TaxID=105023 RepID=A0A1A8UNN7_NOTFU
MYTITRGPSKLVTQRRTGPSQQLDNKINDFKHKQTPWNMPDLPAPKIVFSRLNGKKHHPSAQALPSDIQREETFSYAHEENVKFVSEAWRAVVHQEVETGPGLEVSQRTVHYKETTPGLHLDSEYSCYSCWFSLILSVL